MKQSSWVSGQQARGPQKGTDISKDAGPAVTKTDIAQVWQDIQDTMEARSKVEAKFNRQLNAVRAGKLHITPNFVDEDEPPPNLAKKRLPASAHRLLMQKDGGRQAQDKEGLAREERGMLPPIHEKRGSDAPSAGDHVQTSGHPRVFGDFVGLTTSDFERPAGAAEREALELRQEWRRARSVAADQAQAFRSHLSATIGGPCYGNKALAPKLQLLRSDPELQAALNAVVFAYRCQSRLAQRLAQTQGPLAEQRASLHSSRTLPQLRRVQSSPSLRTASPSSPSPPANKAHRQSTKYGRSNTRDSQALAAQRAALWMVVVKVTQAAGRLRPDAGF